jgi:hypothetical protein
VSGQLVLAPQLRFGELCSRLAQAGWQAAGQAGAPLVAGEPEHALFERAGAHLVYTFNPVCSLRLLDTSAAGPAWSDALLPVAGAGEVHLWLESHDERTLLRGLLAAAQLGHAALAPQVDAQRGHSHPTIARAAERTLQLLVGDAAGVKETNRANTASGLDPAEADPAGAARGGALLGIALLKEQLTPLLYALAQDRDGRIAARLQPQAADFLLAFRPDAAVAASEAYAAAALTARVAPVSGAGHQVQVALAPAGMLGDDNALSRQFPSGYRAIAHLLAPQRIWARWKYLPRGAAAGVAYDGLVWLDERWVWFAKPYRVLSV